MPKSLTISELTERCQIESSRYQQTGQSDEIYCLELFRRALTERDEAAWQAVYAQYQPLVLFWVRGYSRFPQTGEEVDFFVNGAFARLWQFGSKAETAVKLDRLDKNLRYLKLCVGSAVEDYLRRAEKDALIRAASLADDDRSRLGIEAQVANNLSLTELKETLWMAVQDEPERLVAEESWIYGFAPRQIQERHSETFATAGEVSEIKHNILKRLRRKLKEEIGK